MLKLLLFTALLLSSITALKTTLHKKSQSTLLKSKNSAEQSPLESQQVYRWYSPQRENHFYTLDPNGEGVGSTGYVYEGVEFCTLKQPTDDTIPLYRLSSGYIHFYTTSLYEAQVSGFAQEGDIGNIFATETSVFVQDVYGEIQTLETVPLYRWYKPGANDHFYFVNPAVEFHVQNGYQEATSPGYVIPCQQEVVKVRMSDLAQVSQEEVGAEDYTLDDGLDSSSDMAFYTLKTQVGNSVLLYKFLVWDGSYAYSTDPDPRWYKASRGNALYVFKDPIVVTIEDDNGVFYRNQRTVPLYVWYSMSLGSNSEPGVYSTNPSVGSQLTGWRYGGIVCYVLPRKL